MRRRRRHGLLACVLVLLAAALGIHPVLGRSSKPKPSVATPTTTVLGTVTSVPDGDTLVILDTQKTAHRIRLLGIDAPEGGQPYGKVAKQVLLQRVIGKQVEARIQSRDRYGRSVAKLLLDGADINLELVQEGMAWHYRHYASDQFPGDAPRYAAAERDARTAQRGLWNLPNPEPPWEWRREHRRP